MTVQQERSYYGELTSRNAGFIAAPSQRRLADAVVLVAGCGSTGGAAVEPLARLGVQHFRLADNGAYELNNLNRQHAGHRDVERNKAAVSAERVLAINPGAEVAVFTDGVRPESLTELLQGVGIVIDGVDVTERRGLVAKWALHVEAARQGIPVISGYDMAGVQYVRVYDYRRRRASDSSAAPLDGAISAADIDALAPFQVLARLIPRRYVPLELITELSASLGEPDYHLPQLIYTSLLFGALSARLTVDLLDRRRVRTHIVVDVHRVVRPALTNARIRARTPIEAARLLRRLR